MVSQICDFLVDKMRAEMPDIDDERAEVIHYGLENFIGELPKIFLLFVSAVILQIIDLTIISNTTKNIASADFNFSDLDYKSVTYENCKFDKKGGQWGLYSNLNFINCSQNSFNVQS